ncbi:MAG: hypothetical protein K6G10_00435 [Butyrivibrio sp.]|nr:hypothetical protein [Butyrivibrio sp.]
MDQGYQVPYNRGSAVDKLISYAESGTENEYGDFCVWAKKTINDIEEFDYSELLLLFWGLLATTYKRGYSEYSDVACKIAFKAMCILLRRKNTSAAKDLVIYSRDDLFIIYLTDLKLYYTVVNAFYMEIIGSYPDFWKNGYVSVYNVINGYNDTGYMDADYIYIAAWSAEFAYNICKGNNEVGEDDLEMYSLMKKMYFDFTDFANMGYGMERHNKPKEKELYKKALSKPINYIRDSEDKFRRRPLWTAMAYATGDASGEYKWRHQVTKLLGMEDFCPAPNSDELLILKGRKKSSIIRIIIMFILLIMIVFSLKLYTSHPVAVVVGVLILLAAALEDSVNSGHGSNIWYLGHFYRGPAYWLGGRW